MTKELLLRLEPSGECVAAVVRDGQLQGELVRCREAGTVGNIYKARVVNIEPSIQSSFLNFGGPRNGFLHVSDVEPAYFGQLMSGRPDPDGEEPPGPGRPRPKPLIQDILKRGQEVLVQVLKEGIGTKGPIMSTYLSIPGRDLVLMPGLNRIGVSRKIEDEETRRRLRATIESLRLPPGLGLILRTAGEHRTRHELQQDVDYLERVWSLTVRRIRERRAPAEVYREGDAVASAFRRTFTDDLDKVHVNTPEAFERAREVADLYCPGFAGRVRLDEGPGSFFEQHGIEESSKQPGDAL